MTLKLTGGKERGRSIPSPRGRLARPTSSKIRQALFNILGDLVLDANFLDLYAGSGIMGLEALSRGALTLTAVEINRKLAGQIKSSAEEFGYEAEIFAEDVRSTGGKLEKEYFDLIFADPPYGAKLSQPTIHLVDRKRLLRKNGVFILEHQHNTILDLSRTSLVEVDKRTYGQTVLSFLKRTEDIDAE